MTLVTILFASTQFTAKCPADIPLRSACAFTFCAIASDSPRNSVSRMRLSLRPTRDSAGGSVPGVYLPVSTPRASGLYGTTATPCAWHAEPLARVHHFADAPAAEVRHAEVARLARADDVAHGDDRLFDRRLLD